MNIWNHIMALSLLTRHKKCILTKHVRVVLRDTFYKPCTTSSPLGLRAALNCMPTGLQQKSQNLPLSVYCNIPTVPSLVRVPISANLQIALPVTATALFIL